MPGANCRPLRVLRVPRTLFPGHILNAGKGEGGKRDTRALYIFTNSRSTAERPASIPSPSSLINPFILLLRTLRLSPSSFLLLLQHLPHHLNSPGSRFWMGWLVVIREASITGGGALIISTNRATPCNFFRSQCNATVLLTAASSSIPSAVTQCSPSCCVRLHTRPLRSARRPLSS